MRDSEDGDRHETDDDLGNIKQFLEKFAMPEGLSVREKTGFLKRVGRFFVRGG
jgi:hypothetical protein